MKTILQYFKHLTFSHNFYSFYFFFFLILLPWRKFKKNKKKKENFLKQFRTVLKSVQIHQLKLSRARISKGSFLPRFPLPYFAELA